MAQEEPPARPNTKQQTLLRCQRIETMLKINSENRIVKQPIYDAVREWTKGASRLTHQSRRGEYEGAHMHNYQCVRSARLYKA